MDQELLNILTRIESKIDEHSSILKEHSSILKEHSSILNEHSSILNEHSSILKEHSDSLKEHTLILRALEHSAEVNKSEHDRMSNDIAHIKGDVVGIRKDIMNVEIITSSNWNEIVKLKAVK